MILAHLFALLGGATVLVTGIRFAAWRADIHRRLLRGSTVIQTARGAAEYAELGSGPVVLLLHGTPGGYDQTLRMIEASGAMDGKARFLCPSRPGYLRTPLASGRSPAAQADLCAALLDVLDIDRAFVIGASGGGPAAVQFALRFPGRCNGLVLEAAVTQSIAVRKIPIPAILADLLVYLFRNFAIAKARASAPDDPVLAQIARGVLETVVPVGPRMAGFDNDRAAFSHLDGWPLEQITCPALIVYGTADTDVPAAHALHAHAAIAGSRLVAIAGADHNLFVTEHARLNHAIAEFMAGVLQAHPPEASHT